MKKVILLALLVGVAFAQLDLSDQNCENVSNTWICQKEIIVSNATGFLKDNIGCFSTDGNYPDLGCLAAIELQKDVKVQNCKYTVTESNIESLPCETETLSKGDSFVSSVDPALLDLSSCQKYQNDTLYITECSVMGKEIVFSGFIERAYGEDVLFVTDMKITSFDLSKAIMENLVYIVLIIIIIVMAYWVFAPHKPMYREKKAAPELPKEAGPSKREKRYGRKL
jgi:hypothetical protein